MMNDHHPLSHPTCEACGSTDCLFDCPLRWGASIEALAVEHPDMPRSELYRLDAHQWLEAHYTFEEQVELDAQIEADQVAKHCGYCGASYPMNTLHYCEVEPEHCDCWPHCGAAIDCTRE